MSEMNAISKIDQQNVSSIKHNKKASTSNTNFSSYLGESITLDAIFEKASKKYNVPVNLLKSIGKAESNFDTKAVSKSGAQGVMQLMPATAAELGVTDSFDAEQNIMGGSKYISELLKRYNGDTKLALAAYNAGSGNVKKYGGIPPFEETQNYVVKVMNYMKEDINTGATTVSSKSTKQPQTTVANLVDATANNPATTNNPATFLSSYSINLNKLLSQDMDTSEGLAEVLDAIFSYDDYVQFLDKLLATDNEKDTEEETNNYYASKQINYNLPVMNLLNSIN